MLAPRKAESHDEEARLFARRGAGRGFSLAPTSAEISSSGPAERSHPGARSGALVRGCGRDRRRDTRGARRRARRRRRPGARGRVRPRAARRRLLVPHAAPAGRGGRGALDRRGVRGARRRERARDPGDAVRRRVVAGGARDPRGGRDQPRPHRDGRDRRAAAAGHARRRAARGGAQRARAGSRRARPVLPGRSRRRRDARRDGGHQRVGHDDGALREDARERPRRWRRCSRTDG